MRGRIGSPRDIRGRSRRGSEGADETVIFDPPPRGGGGSGGRSGRAEDAAATVRGAEVGSGRTRLVDLCSDWLAMIVALRQAPDPNLDANLIRNRAVELKSRLEQDGARNSINPVDVEAAVFGLIAFLDETAIRAGGALRDAWFQRPMQLELFGPIAPGRSSSRVSTRCAATAISASRRSRSTPAASPSASSASSDWPVPSA